MNNQFLPLTPDKGQGRLILLHHNTRANSVPDPAMQVPPEVIPHKNRTSFSEGSSIFEITPTFQNEEAFSKLRCHFLHRGE